MGWSLYAIILCCCKYTICIAIHPKTLFTADCTISHYPHSFFHAPFHSIKSTTVSCKDTCYMQQSWSERSSAYLWPSQPQHSALETTLKIKEVGVWCETVFPVLLMSLVCIATMQRHSCQFGLVALAQISCSCISLGVHSNVVNIALRIQGTEVPGT